MERRDAGLKYVAVLAGSAGSLPVMLRQLDRLFIRDSSCLFIAYHRGEGAFDLANYMPSDVAFEAREAETGLRVEANHVYYPRDADDLEVRNGQLVVSLPQSRFHPNIDRLLTSLASEYGEKVLAVLLSGGGTDGIEGMRAVKRAGGITIAQDPEMAIQAGLPAAALASGAAEHVLSTGEILRFVDAALAGERIVARS